MTKTFYTIRFHLAIQLLAAKVAYIKCCHKWYNRSWSLYCYLIAFWHPLLYSFQSLSKGVICSNVIFQVWLMRRSRTADQAYSYMHACCNIISEYWPAFSWLHVFNPIYNTCKILVIFSTMLNIFQSSYYTHFGYIHLVMLLVLLKIKFINSSDFSIMMIFDHFWIWQKLVLL